MSKTWVQANMRLYESLPIFGEYFLLTRAHNTGGAWSILAKNNSFFIVFALLAIVALLIAYHRSKEIDTLMAGAFSLALGGAMGNLLDRVRFGYVVDFFEARIIRWPIFNIADTAISCAILLLIVHFFRTAKEETKTASSEREAPEQH
jgi:signal peptidase II